MNWLTSFVDIGDNFRNLTIEWEKGRSKMILRGDPSLYKAQVSWRTIDQGLAR